MNFFSYCNSIPHNLNIQMNNIPLDLQKNEVKYLGIIFDSNLKWDKHFEYILNKTEYLPLLCIFSQFDELWIYSLRWCLQ